MWQEEEANLILTIWMYYNRWWDLRGLKEIQPWFMQQGMQSAHLSLMRKIPQPGIEIQRLWLGIVEFWRAQVAGCECVATYSGRPVAARLFIGQQQWQCSSAKLLNWCVFIFGTRYLSLGVLSHVFGVRYTVSVLVSMFRPANLPAHRVWD